MTLTTLPSTSALDPEVEAALPQGKMYTMPEEWRLALAEIDVRKESPTSITTFLMCPLKWYLDRYSDLEDSGEVIMAGVVGTFVHRVLEVFYSEPAKLRTPELLDTTFKTAWDALKSHNEEDGVVSPDLIAELRKLEVDADNPDALRGAFYNRAKKAIENALEFDLDPSKVQVVSNEMWVRAQVHDVQIRGKIDRVDRAPRGMEDIKDYKGLALDTPLPTPTGWTTMGEVQQGDQVLGSDGRPTTVTLKSAVHNRPCYRITFQDGSTIVCDNVHLWEVTEAGVTSVRDADGVYDALQRAQAARRPRALTIQNSAPLRLPLAQLPLPPWLVGALLGRGTSGGSGLITRDGEGMLPLLKGVWEGQIRTTRRGNSLLIQLVGGGVPELVPLLEGERIPLQYLRGSVQQRLELLQGVMDAGGSWSSSRGVARFSTPHPGVAQGVAELVASLGITPSTLHRPGTRSPHQVTFNPVGFNPFQLPSKAIPVEEFRAQGRSAGKGTHRVIGSMERVESVPTQCIQVDAPDSLYLAGPLMVPTHNTGRVPSGEPNVLDPTFVPAGLYAWMRTKMTEHDMLPATIRSVQLLYLTHLKRCSIRITPAILQRIDQLVHRVVEMMDHTVITGEIMACPEETPDEVPCRWCPAKGICPAWTDGTFDKMRSELEI